MPDVLFLLPYFFMDLNGSTSRPSAPNQRNSSHLSAIYCICWRWLCAVIPEIAQNRQGIPMRLPNIYKWSVLMQSPSSVVYVLEKAPPVVRGDVWVQATK